MFVGYVRRHASAKADTARGVWRNHDTRPRMPASRDDSPRAREKILKKIKKVYKKVYKKV